MILFSSDLELILENKIIMNKLIIDVASEKIFLMIITSNDIYNITKENTKINYEKLTLIINDFLNSHQLNLKDISTIYLNRGPGSFAGIRNSFSIVKAFNLTNNIDDYLKIRKSLFLDAMKSPLFNTEDYSKSFFESLRKIVQ